MGWECFGGILKNYKMKKKVLLIEPGTDVLYPPIGLMCLASAIRNKYDVSIRDYSAKTIKEREIENIIKMEKPFVVGLRVLTGPCIPRAILISKIAKKYGAKVMWGGPHPTILPKQTLENDYIDAVCIGEGEITILDILSHFEGNKKDVFGAGIKKNGKIKLFPPQKEVVNFDKLALPSWDLLKDINRYFPDKNHNSVPISTTRGCVFKCGFCHNSNENVKKFLGGYRIAEPKRAIDEYMLVQKLAKNKIDFLDVGEDLHLVSPAYARKFCKALEDSKIKNLRWNTAARYSVMTEEMVDLIAKYNCKSIMLGVESGSKRIQEFNGKIVEMNHAIKIAKHLRKRGIFLRNTYIFGHPTETEEELKMTKKYLKKVPSDENLIQLYRPMPATPYFDLCQKDGKIKNLPNKLEEWSGFGVLGHDVNVSRIPTKKLFKEFFKVNAIEQLKYLANEQRFYLNEKMYRKFFKNFIENRFTHKLKEFLQNRK